MIKLIDKLPKINKESVALARIECTFCAYGNYPQIALFWQQENESGEITALFSLLDGNLTLFAQGVNEELRLFIKALSPATVISAEMESERFCRVVVAPDQLSLAIGKEGQNVRLAARLTGVKIDINAEGLEKTRQVSVD
jgi:hypothetical protein